MRFVEQLGSLGVGAGAPRSMVLLLGWLVVCDPPEQTAQQIQTGLQLSAGTVSTTTRALIDLGMVERRARAGDRRTYYRLREQAWERVIEARQRALGQVREVVERALTEAGDEAGARLVQMRDLYTWYGEQTEKLLAGGNWSGERSLV
jgi:DNA-binding transcriptional regulator GbsR (MarR family)